MPASARADTQWLTSAIAIFEIKKLAIMAVVAANKGGDQVRNTSPMVIGVSLVIYHQVGTTRRHTDIE